MHGFELKSRENGVKISLRSLSFVFLITTRALLKAYFQKMNFRQHRTADICIQVFPFVLIIIWALFMASCSQESLKKSSKLNNRATVKDIQLDTNATDLKASEAVQEIGIKQGTKTEIRLTEEQYAYGEELEKKYSHQIGTIDAKKIFRNYCTNCHGIKGNLQLNGAKDLTVIESTVARNISQVYFGKGLMTPFRNTLDEKEIVAVANYVQSLRK